MSSTQTVTKTRITPHHSPTIRRTMSQEQEILRWISELLHEEPYENISLFEYLQDSKVLCRLLNVVQPGSIPDENFNFDDIPEVQSIENIGLFIDGCRSLGVSEEYMFRAIDLREGNDTNRVIDCLSQLKEAVRIKNEAQKQQQIQTDQRSKSRTNSISNGKKLSNGNHISNGKENRNSLKMIREDIKEIRETDGNASDGRTRTTKRSSKIIRRSSSPQANPTLMGRFAGGVGSYIVAPMLTGIALGVGIKLGREMFINALTRTLNNTQ